MRKKVDGDYLAVFYLLLRNITIKNQQLLMFRGVILLYNELHIVERT